MAIKLYQEVVLILEKQGLDWLDPPLKHYLKDWVVSIPGLLATPLKIPTVTDTDHALGEKMNFFANYSNEYSQFRPTYPEDLFDYLAKICPTQDSAWDCGSGNGQAALYLAKHFQNVIATDTSQEQLALAPYLPNIQYVLSPAEETVIPDKSIDLIVIAQALHWFDLDKFYMEVVRVAKPKGFIAGWCYFMPTINEEIDCTLEEIKKIICEYSTNLIQIKYVHDQYKTIPFPFKGVCAPKFSMTNKWSCDQFIGHLKTWPSIRKFNSEFGEATLNNYFEKITLQWDRLEKYHLIQWPLNLLLGQVLSEE